MTHTNIVDLIAFIALQQLVMLVIITFMWFALWHIVLKRIPVVREFFDLDLDLIEHNRILYNQNKKPAD